MDEEITAPPLTDDPDGTPVSTRRMEAFTDGVFSIAATLLVLDLSVDKFPIGIHSDVALWSAIGDQGFGILSFVISFLLLGLLWRIHVWQFEFVSTVDSMGVFLNTLRLLGVVLIPFTTSLISNYNDLLAGRTLLPLNFLFVTAVSAIQWYHLTSARHSFVSGLTPAAVRSTRIGSLIAVGLALVTVALSPWLGSIAFVASFLNPVFDRFRTPRPKGVRKRHH
ncbi:TMEM175 family protein [Leifsonia sp. NPDC058292]|uniref:TMEM175 family protein n=1 Tax=Leifsonia sp. NPDC058292 TaxID=3346428 RepID=UPI0036D763A0